MSGRKLPIGIHINELAQHWPEGWAQTNAATLLIYRSREQLFSECLSALEAHALQSGEFEVLCSLRSSPPPFELTPTEIYRNLLFSSGGLTKVLARLADRGLVTRRANPADGRGQLVKLSDAGHALMETAMRDVSAAESTVLSGLDGAEQRQLAALLGKVLAAHEASPAE